MSREKEWSESFGVKFAVISWIYSFISKALAEMKIGPEIIKWVKSNEGIFALREAVEHVGEKFLVAKAAENSTAHQFPVWKTIRRNPDRRTAEDYLQALKERGCDVSDAAMIALQRTTLWDEADAYDLFCLSGEDLGLGSDRIIPKKLLHMVALAKGFILCPAWIGPELREGFDDQPYNEYLPIAMGPILMRNGIAAAFGLLKTEGVCGQEDHVLLNIHARHELERSDLAYSSDRYVFARRRPVQAE